ncbi:hypothetical protein LTS18_004117, partial [Coniosporium uncinatum]
MSQARQGSMHQAFHGTHGGTHHITQQFRQMSTDPRNEVHPYVEHYIGVDVGTGSARACIMNEKGDIVGLASQNIGLWQPQTGYY